VGAWRDNIHGRGLSNNARADELIERNFRILALGAAHPRDVASLQNWHMENACISREEIEFLGRHEDLLCLSTPGDGLVSWLERSVSEKLLLLSKVGHHRMIRATNKREELTTPSEVVRIYPETITSISILETVPAFWPVSS
jgi:uncharacterized protein DUF6594